MTPEELGEVFKAQWKDQDITQASAYFYELYEISEVTSANVTNVISKIDCIQIFQKNNIKDTPSIEDITRYLACLYAILCRESNTFSADSLLNFDIFKKRAIAEYVKVKGDNLVGCNSIGILKIDDFKDTSTLGWFKDVVAKNSSFSSPPPSPIKKINNATNTASRKTISTQPSKKKCFKDLELYKQGKEIPFSEEFLKGQNIMVIIFDEIKEAGSKTLVSGAYPYTFKK